MDCLPQSHMGERWRAEQNWDLLGRKRGRSEHWRVHHKGNVPILKISIVFDDYELGSMLAHRRSLYKLEKAPPSSDTLLPSAGNLL